MLKVYLAGEIHTNWREEIIENCKKENLDIQFASPVTDHPSSDDCGIEILGPEEKNLWKDRKGANINSIRTKKSIKDSDVVVVKFGEKYKQWNAAFDAGYASALNKSIIVIHASKILVANTSTACSSAWVSKSRPFMIASRRKLST